MTEKEIKQMRKIFPRGWSDNDVPAFIRKRERKENNFIKRYLTDMEKLGAYQDENGEWQV